MAKLLKFIPLGIISCTLLTACGGSDGGDESVQAPTVTTPVVPPSTKLARCTRAPAPLITTQTTSIEFKTEANYYAGQSAMITASIPAQNNRDLRFLWQQTSGTPIRLVSQNSPVLAFDIPTAGNYSFSLHVEGTDINSSENISISASDNVVGQLNIRQDHQVVAGNGVSLRLAQAAALDSASISWCVAMGDDLTVDLSDPFRPLFAAPTVQQDSITQLRVSAAVNGVTVTEDAFVLTTAQAPISSPYFDLPVARTHSYNPASPYAKALTKCVYSNQINQACTISELPLIGQTNSTGDVTPILDRVVVSHDWMGDNFAAYLTQMDPNSDFAKLLQSVTAIVISYDIRPSFYWVVTGAIYLDPNDLWLTPTERDTINEAPDYRGEFGDNLQFLMPWRYVKNNQYTSLSFPITSRHTRNLNQINADLASLLYHELAHANDFFPRSVHTSLTGPTLLDDYRRRNNNQALASDNISRSYPLTSTEMTALAAVSFLGTIADSTQTAYQADDVTAFFSNDIANDFYAYSSTREDTAMLFEEAMMSYRYQILRDVAVANNPSVLTADTLIVDWGQRGRIGDANLASRAALAINEILPELNGVQIIDNLPEPVAMKSGQSWRQTLGVSARSVNATNAASPSAETSNWSSDSEPALRFSGDRHH